MLKAAQPIVSWPIMTICVLFPGVNGCQVIANALDKTSDPKAPALYVPEQQTMAVLVEDYQNPALVEIVADHMDRLIAGELIANKVAPIINPDRLTTFKSDHPEEYRKVAIPNIGDHLTARQLLYVDITEFIAETAAGTNVMKGHAEARVKIVDCVTGQTRWPKDGTTTGYTVTVNIPFSLRRRTSATLCNCGTPSPARPCRTRSRRFFYDAITNQPDPAPSFPENRFAVSQTGLTD